MHMALKFDPGYSFRSSESLRQRDERRQRDRHAPAALVPSGTTEGQRPCARGKWCASAKNVEQPGGTIERIPGFTYRVFCQPCTDRITDALTDMPGAYVRIEAEYGTPVRRNDQAIRVPFGPSIPIRLDVDALQREAPPSSAAGRPESAASPACSCPTPSTPTRPRRKGSPKRARRCGCTRTRCCPCNPSG